MKAFIKTALFACLVFSLLFIPSAPVLAQAADSTAAAGPEVIDTFFGITIPPFAKIILVSLLVLLPAVQFTLKRIPTEGSVKIQGLLGKVLDFLTFFQKDKIKK